jgi:hypothetical protein
MLILNMFHLISEHSSNRKSFKYVKPCRYFYHDSSNFLNSPELPLILLPSFNFISYHHFNLCNLWRIVFDETIYLQYVNLTTYEMNLQVLTFSISVASMFYITVPDMKHNDFNYFSVA